MKMIQIDKNYCAIRPHRLVFQNKPESNPLIDPSKFAGKISGKAFEKVTGGVGEDLKKAGAEALKAFAGVLKTVSSGITDSIKFVKDIIHKDPVPLPGEVERMKEGLTESQARQDRIRYYRELGRAYEKKLRDADVFYAPFLRAYEKLVGEQNTASAKISRIDAMIEVTTLSIRNTEIAFIPTKQSIRALENIVIQNRATLEGHKQNEATAHRHYNISKDAYAVAKKNADNKAMRKCRMDMDYDSQREQIAKNGIIKTGAKIQALEGRIAELEAQIQDPSSGKSIKSLQNDLEDQKRMKTDVQSKVRSFGDADLSPLLSLLLKNGKISPDEVEFLKETTLPLSDFIKSIKRDFMTPLEDHMDYLRANIQACDYKLDEL